MCLYLLNSVKKSGHFPCRTILDKFDYPKTVFVSFCLFFKLLYLILTSGLEEFAIKSLVEFYKVSHTLDIFFRRWFGAIVWVILNLVVLMK